MVELVAEGLAVPFAAVTPEVFVRAIEVALETVEAVRVPTAGVVGLKPVPPKLKVKVPVPAPDNAAVIRYAPVEAVVLSVAKIFVDN